jgi:hypothetical protein
MSQRNPVTSVLNAAHHWVAGSWNPHIYISDRFSGKVISAFAAPARGIAALAAVTKMPTDVKRHRNTARILNNFID